MSKDAPWERVVIKAPTDGLIAEKNFAIGDIVDTSLNMFRLFRPGRKAVLVEAYKDELPKLESLGLCDRTWQILPQEQQSATGATGQFDHFDYQTDPVTENGKVLGWIDDPTDRFKFGQRIRATISLPPPAAQVAIPETALFSHGERNFVFVANRLDARFITLRQVEPIRLLNGKYLVHAAVTEQQQRTGSQSLSAGERVVDRGSLQLFRVFQGLRSAGSAPKVP